MVDNHDDGAIVAEASNFKMADEGTHIARCVKVIHIGKVMETYQGKPSLQDKVRIVFELPNSPREGEIKDGQSPVVLVSKDFTLSVSANSNLRKALKSWQGKDLTPDQEKNFDVRVLATGRDRENPKGVAAMISIAHKTSEASKKKYVDVTAIMGVPAGMEVPAQINASFVFSHGTKDNKKFIESFMKLDKFLQDKVKKSEQWTAREKSIQAENPSLLTQVASTAPPAPESQGEDDLPF